MNEVPVFEPAAVLTSPIDLAVVGEYDLVVLESDRVRYFSYDGAGMVENPALAVTGLTNPVAFATEGGGEVAVVEGTQVKHYTFDGAQMIYNSALAGTAVAWEADARPQPPLMTVPGWFYTTTPLLSWTFSDPDGRFPDGFSTAGAKAVRRSTGL